MDTPVLFVMLPYLQQSMDSLIDKASDAKKWPVDFLIILVLL